MRPQPGEAKLLEALFRPQCPWIVPLLAHLRGAAVQEGLSYREVDLSQTASPVRGILVVLLGGRMLPIGIGTSEAELVNALRVALGREPRAIPPEPPPPAPHPPRKAQEITLEPIAPGNLAAVADLCLGEGFLYGPMPEEHRCAAQAMRIRWLGGLLDRHNFVGLLALADGAPAGFIEVVPGSLAREMGMEPVHPATETWVIPCLAVAPRSWGQGIGSGLVWGAIRALTGKTEWLEVYAHHHGPWQPVEFYRHLGFVEARAYASGLVMAKALGEGSRSGPAEARR